MVEDDLDITATLPDDVRDAVLVQEGEPEAWSTEAHSFDQLLDMLERDAASARAQAVGDRDGRNSASFWVALTGRPLVHLAPPAGAVPVPSPVSFPPPPLPPTDTSAPALPSTSMVNPRTQSGSGRQSRPSAVPVAVALARASETPEGPPASITHMLDRRGGPGSNRGR